MKYKFAIFALFLFLIILNLPCLAQRKLFEFKDFKIGMPTTNVYRAMKNDYMIVSISSVDGDIKSSGSKISSTIIDSTISQVTLEAAFGKHNKLGCIESNGSETCAEYERVELVFAWGRLYSITVGTDKTFREEDMMTFAIVANDGLSSKLGSSGKTTADIKQMFVGFDIQTMRKHGKSEWVEWKGTCEDSNGTKVPFTASILVYRMADYEDWTSSKTGDTYHQAKIKFSVTQIDKASDDAWYAHKKALTDARAAEEKRQRDNPKVKSDF